MNRMIKIICAVVTVTIGTVLVASESFSTDGIMPIDSISIISVTVDSNSININACFPDPVDRDLRYSRSKYSIEGSKLFVVVYTTSDYSREYDPSPFDIKIKGNFGNANTIYIKDRTKEKAIWDIVSGKMIY